MPDTKEIHNKIKEFIVDELLGGEDADELEGDTELVRTGILDSVSTLRVVAFIEGEWDMEIETHEANLDNLGSLDAMTKLVESKL
ncbi:MAG: acyl carrier protein [Myxococcales bacterium]|nr:acyl carrier protein [Myxococcales bacterium]